MTLLDKCEVEVKPVFNPIALRMTKTLWSYGLSECNRVKRNLTLLHLEWPKLYGVLAFLSAIGLKTK